MIPITRMTKLSSTETHVQQKPTYPDLKFECSEKLLSSKLFDSDFVSHRNVLFLGQHLADSYFLKPTIVYEIRNKSL